MISGSRPSCRPLLLGFTVCAAPPPVAADWIQRRGRGETVCVMIMEIVKVVCGLESVCVHTLKHKDESAEGGGVVLALRGEKCGFIHIKGSCLRPIPTLDLPRCVSVCVSAPGKPGIDIQLSTELIQVSTGDRRASQHHKSFHRR